MKTISSGDSPSKLNILINSLKEPFILNPCNFVFDEMTKNVKISQNQKMRRRYYLLSRIKRDQNLFSQLKIQNLKQS